MASSYRGHLSSHNHVTDVAPAPYTQQTKRGSLDPVIFIDIPDRDDRPVEPVIQHELPIQQSPVETVIQSDRADAVNKYDRPGLQDRRNSRPKAEPLPQIFVTISEEGDHQATYSRGDSTCPPDDFSLSPLPLAHPTPPPSYGEVVDLDSRPPRTTVITMSTPSPKDRYRRHLICQHCDRQVHSVVCRQIGPVNHVLAIVFLLTCLVPLIILVYCLDTFKSRVHYCPACSKAIGREEPIICTEMVYASQ